MAITINKEKLWVGPEAVRRIARFNYDRFLVKTTIEDIFIKRFHDCYPAEEGKKRAFELADFSQESKGISLVLRTPEFIDKKMGEFTEFLVRSYKDHSYFLTGRINNSTGKIEVEKKSRKMSLDEATRNVFGFIRNINRSELTSVIIDGDVRQRPINR